MTLVVDASVAVKLFIDEPDSTAARKLFARDELVVAPAHFFGEIGEVGIRRTRAKQIGLQQLMATLDYLRMGVTLIPLVEIFKRGTTIALDAGTSFYDALYVAAAEQWHATLVTADRKLIEKLARSAWASMAISLGEWVGRD
jgi:predicted nucleic acid-binding protein